VQGEIKDKLNKLRNDPQLFHPKDEGSTPNAVAEKFEAAIFEGQEEKVDELGADIQRDETDIVEAGAEIFDMEATPIDIVVEEAAVDSELQDSFEGDVQLTEQQEIVVSEDDRSEQAEGETTQE
jgi:hypothetical protein